MTETYHYDALSGLLTRQKVIKGGNNLLDLSYDYNRNSSVGNINGKTGHLTKTTDNLNNTKNKEYEFDALGRLTKWQSFVLFWRVTERGISRARALWQRQRSWCACPL